MALKFGRMTLIPIGILASLPSCGKKTAENEGFLPKLSELDRSDIVDETEAAGFNLWDAVRKKLEVSGSLATPSTLITDSTKAETEATSKVGAVVMGSIAQKCNAGAATGPFLTDLTDTIKGGLSAKGITIETGGFKIDPATGAPTNLGGQSESKTKVYLMSYKLNDDSDFRYAFFSVPQTPPAQDVGAVQADTTGGTYGYPLMLYAHAATSGLSFGEIAKSLGDLQLNNIVLAPAFPGEKICISPTDADATVCSDDINKTSAGVFAPYETDVTDLLGAYECVRTKMTTFAATGSSGKFDLSTGGSPVGINTYAKISHEMAVTGKYGTSLNGAALQPITIGVGLGRGANVIALAQQRAGAINSILSSDKTDDTTTALKAKLTEAGIAAPETFNCSLAAGGNYTFAHGLNQVFVDYWVSGYTKSLTEAQTTAIEGIPGFKEIHAKIAAIVNDAGKDQETKATEIATYIKLIDSTFQMPLLHGSVANWGKVYRAKYNKTLAEGLATAGQATEAAAAASTAKKTLAAAQGSYLLVNGLKDNVASVTNTQLLSGIGSGVAVKIAEEKAKESSTSSLAALGGMNWLALGIVPVSTPDDNGHVADVSFHTGKSAAKTTTKMTSTVDDSQYLDKTPNEIIKSWLTNECLAKSISADPKE
jgi:hypothetical protein